MNKIVLEINKTITKLAGNDLGKKIFREQVKDKIEYGKPITIEIPVQIDSLASSFIQGFFEDIVNHIGISGVEKNIEIVSAIPNAKELIVENLL